MRSDLLKAACIAVSALLCCCCGEYSQFERDELDGTQTLKVTSWNTETFFDGENDGHEYQEFVNSRVWGREAYVERLKRLCSVIKVLDSDVVILEEVENQGVLQDVSNFLAGEWDDRKLYAYACFVKPQDSSIGLGVLSRFPLSNLQVHSLEVRSDGQSMPSMRPVVRVTVHKDNRQLELVVNHWKSMSGGKEETECWRDWQEAVAARVAYGLEHQGKSVLLAGDFNRDVLDFVQSEREGHVVFREGRGKKGSGSCVELKSPWFLTGKRLVQPGSYFYKGQWSRIDNFFFCGTGSLFWFNVETEGPWCREDSTPYAYEIWTGEGYSDHLPISCMVSF